MKDQVGRPWSVQVEMTEGCTRMCDFCGLQGIRKGPGDFKRMTVEHASKIAMDLETLCPTGRIEFAMHGEPMANPNYLGIVLAFRRFLPKAQMQITTNGFKFLRGDIAHKLWHLFSAGVDFVIVDTYRPERDKLRARLEKIGGSVSVVDLYKDWQPKGISPWHNHHRKIRNTVVMIDDLGMADGAMKSRVIFNHAGNNPGRPVPERPLKKTCTLPFREMSICWNGDVCVCCMDFAHEMVIGNALEKSLSSIWYGHRFESVRKFLRHKRRWFTPCSRCDVGSGTRCGLLPSYKNPSKHDKARIRNMVEAETGIGVLGLKSRVYF